MMTKIESDVEGMVSLRTTSIGRFASFSHLLLRILMKVVQSVSCGRCQGNGRNAGSVGVREEGGSGVEGPSSQEGEQTSEMQ